MKIKHIAIFVLISGLFTACKHTPESIENKTPSEKTSIIKFAKGFDIQHYEGYKKLIIKAPFLNSDEAFEFILSNDPAQKNAIHTPIASVVVTSTTHIPMLELLNVEDKLVGFPNSDYISSEKTRNLVDSGKIIELGNEESINTELLIDLNPDLVIGFSMNSNNKMFQTIEQLGIPVVLNGDWLEKTPLGRAEWIKFFGVLFNMEERANELFLEIEKNYLNAVKIAMNADHTPTIISGGLFKDIWNLPAGESFEATFLKDANTNYLWKDSKGNGSLSLNIENVFDKGKDAELWISPSYYSSFEQLANANSIYEQFKAFQDKKIYSFINKKRC